MTTKKSAKQLYFKDYILAGMENGFPLKTTHNYVVSSQEQNFIKICLRKTARGQQAHPVYTDTNTLTVSELVSVMQPIPDELKRLNVERTTDNLIKIIIDAVKSNTFIIPKDYVSTSFYKKSELLLMIHAFLFMIKTSIDHLQHPDIDSKEYAKEGIDFLGEAVRLTKLYNVLTEMSTLNKSSDVEKKLKCEKLYETAKVLFNAKLSI